MLIRKFNSIVIIIIIFAHKKIIIILRSIVSKTEQKITSLHVHSDYYTKYLIEKYR